MPRLPVVATIRDAYAFTFAHIGSIIGLIWVPMLILTVAGFFSLQRYISDTIEAITANNIALAGPSALMMLCYVAAALLFYAVAYVAVVQLALGTRPGGAMAYFAFGAAEWRMSRALGGFAGLLLGLSLIAVILGQSVLDALARQGRVSGVAANAAPELLFYAVLLLLAPRFLILLPAVSVGESQPVLRRAWALSAGNFLPLLGILIAVVLPLPVVLMGAALLGAVPPFQLPLAGSLQAQQTAMLLWERQALPTLYGLVFLVTPLVVGLLAGASVSAWRRLSSNAEAVTPA